MGFLNKKQILQADDLKVVKVEVPEWGGDVFVRTLSGLQKDSFEQSLLEEGRRVNLDNARAKLCALVIVDDKGNRLFNESDVAALGEKSGLALDRVYAVAETLAGMGKGDVREMVKNSERLGQREDSTST